MRIVVAEVREQVADRQPTRERGERLVERQPVAQDPPHAQRDPEHHQHGQHPTGHRRIDRRRAAGGLVHRAAPARVDGRPITDCEVHTRLNDGAQFPLEFR